MTSLIALYISARRHKHVKNLQHFCMKTRLTSVPTLSKLLKQYSIHHTYF